MEKLRNTRSKKIKEKNKLAGIQQLREAITEEFKDELAPNAFGKIKSKRIRGFHYSLPVNMRTPLLQEYIEKQLAQILKAEENSLILVDIAVSRYKLLCKAPSQKDIIESLRKHLTLARLKPGENAFSQPQTKGDLWETQITFTEPAPTTIVKRAIEKCKFENVELTVVGDAQYRVKGEADEPQRDFLNSFELVVGVRGKMRDAKSEKVGEYLEKVITDNFYKKKVMIEGKEETIYFSSPFPRFTQISGVVAKEQSAKASRAIVIALIAILAYIAIRFPNGLRFGFAAVVALAHDILITLGAIAVFAGLGLVNVSIGLAVIAALLTIVGYSLNDTIVIFDRIRENQRKEEVWDKLDKSMVANVYNRSLNQTLSRTVLTSLTTLFVLVTIFSLNRGTGSIMEGFSFSLIIGVLVGTYSSVFIASSVALGFEYRGRKD